MTKLLTKLILVFLVTAIPARANPEISLTIEQAYELCLEHSLELRTSRLEIMAERRRIALGYWESLPSLSVNLSDSRLTRYNAPDNTSIRLSSSLTVPVFNGGRVRMQRKLDTLQTDLQTLLLSAGEEELKDSCFIHFHELHLLSLKCEALKKTGQLAEKHHAISKKTGLKLHKTKGVERFRIQITRSRESFLEFSRRKSVQAQRREIATTQPKEALIICMNLLKVNIQDEKYCLEKMTLKMVLLKCFFFQILMNFFLNNKKIFEYL